MCDEMIAWVKRILRGFEVNDDTLATETIAQGDTRTSGLVPILREGGVVYRARTGIPWPGSAMVRVSIVHLRRGGAPPFPVLDGRPVAVINAYLRDRGFQRDPEPLPQNAGLCFNGCDLKGLGFLFQDGEPRATPLAVKDTILRAEPRYRQVIRPYVGGEDITLASTGRVGRWVIDLSGMSEAQAREWPRVMDIVQQRVRPERAGRSPDVAAGPWWRFWRERRALYARLIGLERCLACSLVSRHLLWAFYPTDTIFSHKTAVVARQDWATFAVLQSRPHEYWARALSPPRGKGLTYTPTRCFETFPFPPAEGAPWARLQAVGQELYHLRQQIMLEEQQGMTRVWSRMLDQGEQGAGMQALRRARDTMDHAVLEAYGWPGVDPEARDEILDLLRGQQGRPVHAPGGP